MNVKTEFFTFGEDRHDRLVLSSGEEFGPVTLAYETYGSLNEEKNNAILVFHALSGSQHAAGNNAEVPGVGDLWTTECKKGWWDSFIGPGKALDTDKFYVICCNYFGGCYGSTGPRSINPETGAPYGGAFPQITASDVVDTQIRLLDHLGVEQLLATVGASLGGMFALNLSVRYPERVNMVIPIACGMEVTMLQRIHNFEQICAIEEDPEFHNGEYLAHEASPDRGLALARMISHKTFISLSTLEQRARKDVQQCGKEDWRYTINHPVESYMLHQSRKFVKRFDANTYLHIMNIWQRFDLLEDANAKNFTELFKRCRHQRYMIFSIDSDVCFYPDEQQDLQRALERAGVDCQHITVHSEKGHDAFLLEPMLFTPHLVYTLHERW